jgi:FKBP-type peptidyl-prolyl cis-trans isomerase (trigger factor)
MEHKTGTEIARMIMKLMNLKEENLKKIVKKLKNGKASMEVNISSELRNCASEKFKSKLLEFLNEIYIINIFKRVPSRTVPSRTIQFHF